MQESLMNAENKMTMHKLGILHPAVESHAPLKNPHDLTPEGVKPKGFDTLPHAWQA
jgi:hypothetical protein